jgi:aldehyde dehydrogenase (NAD+)
VHRAPDGPSGEGAGHYVAPVLVQDPVAGSRLTTSEVFGPVATMSTVADLAEAVRTVDGTRYGLVTSLYTSDLDAALAFSAEVGTGLVRVNQPTTGVDFHAPFGGEKESSYGPREQGPQAGDFYTRSRTVTIAPGRAVRS